MPTVLEIPAGQSYFLRHLFEAAQEFVREELASAPGSSRHRLQREYVAYEELLIAIDTGLLDPDLDVELVLADLISAIDDDNEYERTVEEHDALVGLLRQVAQEAPRTQKARRLRRDDGQ